MSGPGEKRRVPVSRAPEEGSAPEETERALPPDPELEAALREAAKAIPDPKGNRAGRPARPAAPSGEVLLDEQTPESPQEEAQRLRREITESHDRLIRLSADFDNFRKRALKERQDALQYGHQNLVKDLLSVVDNLDRAIDHARHSEGGGLQSFLQGVELVQRELLAVLGKYHVSEVEARGKPFNPALHEAMGQIPDASVEPNTVVEVLEKGYQLRDRLVRPARVIVAGPASDGGGGEAAD